MFVCGLAQYEEYKKVVATQCPSDLTACTIQDFLAVSKIFFLCMMVLNSDNTGLIDDENIKVNYHESDARDYLEQATEICLYGKVSKHIYILVYTKRSQHAAIENSHANEKRVGLALLKLYSKFFSHPHEAR